MAILSDLKDDFNSTERKVLEIFKRFKNTATINLAEHTFKDGGNEIAILDKQRILGL